MTGRDPCAGTAPGCCLSCSNVFRARYFTSGGPRQQPLFTARLQGASRSFLSHGALFYSGWFLYASVV